FSTRSSIAIIRYRQVRFLIRRDFPANFLFSVRWRRKKSDSPVATVRCKCPCHRGVAVHVVPCWCVLSRRASMQAKEKSPFEVPNLIPRGHCRQFFFDNRLCAWGQCIPSWLEYLT